MTCSFAATNEHLDVLKWAREHGCPWTAATRDKAVTMGYSDNLPLSVRGRLPQLNTQNTPSCVGGEEQDVDDTIQ